MYSFDTLLSQLAARSKELKDDMVNSPPIDMLHFNQRLGRWQENEELLHNLEKKVKGIEDDE